MPADPVTLVAVVAAPTPASAIACAHAAAAAGAPALLVTIAARDHAARLPFELADFATGGAPSSGGLDRAGLEALTAATGVAVVASVSAAGALELTRGLPLHALHVPAPALLDLPLLAAAAGAGVPLWLDTAMAGADEVDDAVTAARKSGGHVTLLHGLATTPARPEELNLRALVALRQRFGLPVGFQAREAVAATATAAVALGATVVAVPFSPDATAGFDAAGLAALLADVRLVARALGDGDKRVQPSEWAARDRWHPSLVARVDIARGTTLDEGMLATARPGIGLKPRAAAGLAGRRAATDIPAGTLITLGMLE